MRRDNGPRPKEERWTKHEKGGRGGRQRKEHAQSGMEKLWWGWRRKMDKKENKGEMEEKMLKTIANA